MAWNQFGIFSVRIHEFSFGARFTAILNKSRFEFFFAESGGYDI